MCARRRKKPENQTTANPLSCDSIEIGTSINDARKYLPAGYAGHNIGSAPRIDVMVFTDGRQLVFTENVLSGKNTKAEIQEVLEAYSEKEG